MGHIKFNLLEKFCDSVIGKFLGFFILLFGEYHYLQWLCSLDNENEKSFLIAMKCVLFVIIYFIVGISIYLKKNIKSTYQKAIHIIENGGPCYIGDKKCEDMTLCKKLLDERPFMIIVNVQNKEKIETLKIFETP